MAELAALIEAEWRAITEKLVKTAREHLEARQSSIVREARQVYAGVVAVFQEQNRARRERARALIDSEKQPGGPAMERSRAAKIAELETQISDLGRLASRLDDVNRNMRREDGKFP
jgi:hypothetical protein